MNIINRIRNCFSKKQNKNDNISSESNDIIQNFDLDMNMDYNGSNDNNEENDYINSNINQDINISSLKNLNENINFIISASDTTDSDNEVVNKITKKSKSIEAVPLNLKKNIIKKEVIDQETNNIIMKNHKNTLKRYFEKYNIDKQANNNVAKPNNNDALIIKSLQIKPSTIIPISSSHNYNKKNNQINNDLFISDDDEYYYDFSDDTDDDTDDEQNISIVNNELKNDNKTYYSSTYQKQKVNNSNISNQGTIEISASLNNVKNGLSNFIKLQNQITEINANRKRKRFTTSNVTTKNIYNNNNVKRSKLEF